MYVSQINEERGERLQSITTANGPTWLSALMKQVGWLGSREAWPGLMERCADPRWATLDEAAWERARVATLLAILREARARVTVDEWGVLDAVDGVIAALELGEDTIAASERADGPRRAAEYVVVRLTHSCTYEAVALRRDSPDLVAARARAAEVAAFAARAAQAVGMRPMPWTEGWTQRSSTDGQVRSVAEGAVAAASWIASRESRQVAWDAVALIAIDAIEAELGE